MKLLVKIMGLRLTEAMYGDIHSYRKQRKFSKRDTGMAVRELIEAGLKVLLK